MSVRESELISRESAVDSGWGRFPDAGTTLLRMVERFKDAEDEPTPKGKREVLRDAEGYAFYVNRSNYHNDANKASLRRVFHRVMEEDISLALSVYRMLLKVGKKNEVAFPEVILRNRLGLPLNGPLFPGSRRAG